MTQISALTTDEFAVPTVVNWSFCMFTSILQQLEEQEQKKIEQMVKQHKRLRSKMNTEDKDKNDNNDTTTVLLCNHPPHKNSFSQRLIQGLASMPLLMK